MSETETESARLSAKPSLTSQQPHLPAPRTLLSAANWLTRYLIVLVPIVIFIASLLGRQFWICEVICNFRAYILIALLTTGPILFSLNRKLLTVAWIGATLWAMMGTVSVFLPASRPAVSLGDAQTIKIMSFNVLGENRQHGNVIAEINRHDPDVLVVVEYANYWHPALERIHAAYPHRLEEPRWHGFGIAIFSKLPMVEKIVSPTAGSRFDSPLVVATVKVGDRELRILSLIHI